MIATSSGNRLHVRLDRVSLGAEEPAQHDPRAVEEGEDRPDHRGGQHRGDRDRLPAGDVAERDEHGLLGHEAEGRRDGGHGGRALRAGDVDLAVAFSYDGSDLGRGEDLEGFVVHPLLDEEVRVALPRDHPLAAKETVSMTDLTDEEWIAGCARCRGHLLTIAHDAGFAPKVAFETEDYVAVQGFVAAGLGVALIPDLIRAATSNPDVSIRPLDPQSRRRIHGMTTDDLLKVPAVAATLEALTVSAQAVDVSVVS